MLDDPRALISARFLLDDGTTHHSPLGAYEPGKRVYIFDVDSGPRWESWRSFRERFGTMETGLVVVRLKPQ